MKYEGDRPYSDLRKPAAGSWSMRAPLSHAGQLTDRLLLLLLYTCSFSTFARFDFASQFEVCRFQISYAILNALL